MAEEPDGPLFGRAYRRADDVDSAEQGAPRRKAWARFVPSFLVAFAEGVLREWMITGVATVSVLMALIGALSGDPAATVGLVASGVLGATLLFVAWRRWSLGWQWLVIVAVLALHAATIVVFGHRL